jgi:hypothetical protein
VLPLLLAGPILRRVEPTGVTVWVAYRKPGLVRLAIWEGRKKSSAPGFVTDGTPSRFRGSAGTRGLGGQLHIAVVTATPEAGAQLRPGAIFCYDVTLEDEQQQLWGLKSFGLLADDPKGAGNVRAIGGVSPDSPRHLALGYEEDVLPSFASSASFVKDIRLAHASCRKTNGGGTDAMSWLDKEIGDNIDKPDKRIQQLYLTGDQIYADEVPTCLLPPLHALATELIGDPGSPDSGEEDLPDKSGNPSVASIKAAPPMRRARIVRTQGGFTSGDPKNHLLTFGEYAAMYMLAWSPRVWRDLASEDACYQHAVEPSTFDATDLAYLVLDKGQPRPDKSEFIALLKKRNHAAFRAERQRVLVFASTVAKVARVVANVSTYMIFDDHEVTDDWNVNASWRNRVYTRPLGRTVLRNALLAYTFFQAWGNDPKRFADANHPNNLLLELAYTYLATARNRSSAAAAELDELIGLEKIAPLRADFHYEAYGLLYQVRVIDTRTRRTFPSPTGVAAPWLLGEDPQSVLDEQLPKGPRRSGTRFMLIISPTPMLGPELLERMLIPLGMQLYDLVGSFSAARSDFDDVAAKEREYPELPRVPGAMFADIETWPTNEPALHEVLARVAGYERVLVLGGDVHYATTIGLDWWSYDRAIGEASKKTSRIVQFTSSAVRNPYESIVEPVYRGYHWLAQWMLGSVFDGFAWKGDHRLTLPSNPDLSLYRYSKLKTTPAILPAFGWPQGTRIASNPSNGLYSLELGPDEDRPDWAWRMSMIRDQRNDAERGEPFSDWVDEIEPGMTAIAATPRGVDRSRALAALHQKALGLSFQSLREVVFTNNVGIVTFETPDDDKIIAIHTLLSTEDAEYPEDNPDEALVTTRPVGDAAHVTRGVPNTVVRAELDPTSDGYPLPRGGVR